MEHETWNIKHNKKRKHIAGLLHASCFMLRRRRGFTLLELLMVIALLSVLGVAGFAYFGGSARQAELSSTAKNIAETLRDARSRALTGQSGMHWGVHFVNSSTAGMYYYELFPATSTYLGATNVVETIFYLPGGISFTSPAVGASTTIFFNKITGMTTTSSVTIASQTATATISVTPVGTVY
jgi:type IV fimbrial biogenesis protein FimT